MAWADSADFTKQDLGPTPLTANLAADGLGGYTDYLESIWFRLGYGDTLGVTKQDIGATPLTFNPVADTLGGYADAAPTIDERGILLVLLPADAKPAFSDELADVFFRLYAGLTEPKDIQGDALSIGSFGALTAGISDTNDVYTDSATLAQAELVNILDSQGEQSDSLNVFTGGTFPLTATPSDSWETLADALGPIWSRLGYQDSLASSKQDLATPLTVNLSADALGSYADSFAPREAILFAPAYDPLYLWDDTLSFTKYSYQLQANPSASVLNQWIDSAAGFRAIAVQISDDINTWADSIQKSSFGPLTFASTDALGSYADSLSLVEGLRVVGRDQWHFSLVPLTVSLSDAKDVFVDGFGTGTSGISVNLTDAKPAFADSVRLTYGLRFEVKEPTELVWTVGGADFDGFRIYRSLTETPFSPVGYYQRSDPAIRTCDIRLAIPAGDWYVAVASYNSTGISPYSNILHIQYAEFGDSVQASTRRLNITDAKPQFVDALSARLPHFAGVGTDDLNASADTLAARFVLRVGITEDAANLADIVATAGDSTYRPGFFDALSVPVDAVQIALTLDVDLTDAQDEQVDAIAKNLGEYVKTEIKVDIGDNLDTWVDELLEDVFNAIDLRVGLGDSVPVYADAFAGRMALDASPSTDANDVYVDGFGWAWYILRQVLTDSKAVAVDSVAAELSIAKLVDLPGVDYDVPYTAWKSLADDNTWQPVEYPADVDV